MYMCHSNVLLFACNVILLLGLMNGYLFPIMSNMVLLSGQWHGCLLKLSEWTYLIFGTAPLCVYNLQLGSATLQQLSGFNCTFIWLPLSNNVRWLFQELYRQLCMWRKCSTSPAAIDMLFENLICLSHWTLLPGGPLSFVREPDFTIRLNSAMNLLQNSVMLHLDV